MAEVRNEIVLRLSHRFAAPRERVFDAWTDPRVLREWWGLSADWSTPAVEVDARPGGRYVLAMQEPGGGATHTVRGEYTEVRRPERIAFTWAWDDLPPGQTEREETLVTVDFNEDGEGTEVVLTHTGFGNELGREQHEHGWTAIMANLERVIA